MSYMKQVPREDFECLTKYHPGEIRYYVDTGIAIAKNRGAKVNVRRKPRSQAGANGTTRNPQSGVAKNQFVQVTVKGAGNMHTDSIQYNVYATATRILANDPTKVMKRRLLVKELVKALPQYHKVSQITPSVTALIRLGHLRYTGAQAVA